MLKLFSVYLMDYNLMGFLLDIRFLFLFLILSILNLNVTHVINFGYKLIK